MNSITEVLAYTLEQKKMALSEAVELHTRAADQVASIQTRLHDAQGRQAAITERRLNCEAIPEDAHEFCVLGADIEALAGMLTQAEAEAESLSPEQARAEYDAARLAWERHEKEEVVRAIHERAKALENRFTACLSELAGLLVEAGHENIRDTWQPSPALETIVRHSRSATIAGLRR